MAAQFITHLFDFRRGAEGVCDLMGDTWEFQELDDGQVKIKAWFKVLSEVSKNNQENSEDAEDFGIIPDMEIAGINFNPAKLYNFYMAARNPKEPRLHQRAQRTAAWFDLDNFEQTVLYEDSPLGKHKIGVMLKTLCQIVGKPKYTNHSLRATGICILKACGFDDRTIAKLTGKYIFKIQILNSYLIQLKFS